MRAFGETPIEFLKGVGSQRAELLQGELGIFTFDDLLNHFPFRYVDRTQIYKISEVNADMPYIQLKGKLSALKEEGKPRQKRLSATFSDESGSIDLVWFKGVNWLKNNLTPGRNYLLFGKPTIFNRRLNIAHPELETEDKSLARPRFQAVYASSEKLRNRKIDNRQFINLQLNLFEHPSFTVPEILPKDLIERLKLITRELAFKWIHFPANNDEMNAALRRLKFDEFFILQISIQRLRIKRQSLKGLIFSKVGSNFNTFFHEQLSFTLTEAQKRVIREIRSDMGSGRQMNRLLQGDVGSGKSIVAFLCLLLAIDNGFQASLMAPTKILAHQHYEGFKNRLESIGVSCALLTGSTKAAARKKNLYE